MIDVTWMPYASISKSVRSLTDQQLQDSWQSAYHSLRSMLGCRNPVQCSTVRLWSGCEIALANYTAETIEEMNTRLSWGEDFIQGELFWALIEDAPRIDAYERSFRTSRVELTPDLLFTSTRKLHELRLLPRWFGWHALHSSHRLALESGDERQYEFHQLAWPWKE